MDKHSHERVLLLIDGREMNAAQHALGFTVDFRKLLSVFRSRGRLIRAIYYAPLVDREDNPQRMLTDWLDYNGFQVVTKLVQEHVDADGHRHVRGNMHVEMAVDAMDAKDHADHLVLFSGHDSMSYLAAALKRHGKRVSVVATLEAKPPLIADRLRRQCDQFIDYVDLEPLIERDGERPAVTEPARERAPDASLPAPGESLRSPDAPTSDGDGKSVVAAKPAPRAKAKRAPSRDR